MNTPEHILRVIRQRRGLDDNDTSQDSKIDALTPRKKLRALAGWELGDEGWADVFIEWANDCGYVVKERESGHV